MNFNSTVGAGSICITGNAHADSASIFFFPAIGAEDSLNQYQNKQYTQARNFLSTLDRFNSCGELYEDMGMLWQVFHNSAGLKSSAYHYEVAEDTARWMQTDAFKAVACKFSVYEIVSDDF